MRKLDKMRDPLFEKAELFLKGEVVEIEGRLFRAERKLGRKYPACWQCPRREDAVSNICEICTRIDELKGEWDMYIIKLNEGE